MSYEPQPPIDLFHTSKDTNNNSNDATTPIDLTNILDDDDDDDIEGVPDSLKSMVAEMNTKLASEQMDFFSMLAVDDDNNINSSSSNNHNNNNDGNHHHYHIASSDQLLMSPDLLVSPPPNPVNQMTETQVKRDLLFTPKPSLFGQPPSPLLPPPRSTELSIRPSEPLTTCTSTTNNDKNTMTTNLRMDYAAPDFFSTPYNPPPSFLLQQPSQLQPMTTILHQTTTMVQPPPPPSYEQPMSLGGGPTTSCIANYASRPPQPPSSPEPPVARAPSPQRRAPSPPQHSEWHELEKGTIETIDIDVFSTTMIPTADMKLPPPPPETSTPSMFHVRASSPKRSVSPKPPKQPNMMIGTVLPNESSASNSKSYDKVSSHQPDPAIAIQNNVLMEQSGHIQPPPRDLETLLTIDALKYNLPPPTPASTVTGPQPLSTPPRSKLSRQQVHDSPSPLSMSSARSNLMTTTTNEERPTVVVPLPLPQRSSTLSSSQPPPVPPRFSPSPIAKSSNSTANDTTHAAPELSRPVGKAMEASSPLSNRSSDKTTSSNGSTKSSRRGDALAKMIASAAKKKSPDPQQSPTKSLRQRLFPSVVTRVAPAPREETKVHQQHQPLGRNNNIGELKSKPKSMPPPIQSRRAAPSATTVDEMFKWSTVSQQRQVKPLTKTIEATQLAKAANEKLQPSLVEEKPERRPIQVAESSALAQSKLQIVLPNAIPPVDNKLLFVTQTIDRPKDSPSDNDHLFLPPALVESSSSTAHFMTGTAVSTARGIGHKETTTATEKVVHIKPLEPTSHLLQTTTAAEGRKHREMEKEIDEPLHPKVHVKPLEPTSHLLQSTTAAEGRRHRDIEKKADDTHHHHTVGSLPLSSTSHLLQSTEARKQATVQPPTLVVHGSPQRVKKLSATSHLLQATAAAEARKTIRKERPLPPAAPPRRVVTGASDSLMKRTTTNKTKVDEGVAKAKERIRQRMLLATRSSSTPYSANSSRTSNSSQRSLTIPKSPKFATNTRHPADPDHKKENPRPSSLAQSDSLFGKSLRSADNSSVGTSFTSRKTNELTVPISPMFSTNARHGSKKSSIEAKENDEPTLAHSIRVLQQSLRSTAVLFPSQRKTKPGTNLTRGVSPKFSIISHRTLPKSTAELEQEEMDKFQKNPFRAKPCPGVTCDRVRSGSAVPRFMMPTQQMKARQGAITTSNPGKESLPPAVATQQSKPVRTSTVAPLVSSQGPFRALPMPSSTFKPPSLKPTIHCPTTEVKPFHFQTSARDGGRHTVMTEVARERANAREKERMLRSQQKEADEVTEIRRKHTLEMRRQQEKHSRLVAKLSPHNVPSSEPRTKPQPFHLSTRVYRPTREQLLQKQQEEESRCRNATFRAKPVPKTTYEFQPIVPKPLLTNGGSASVEHIHGDLELNR